MVFVKYSYFFTRTFFPPLSSFFMNNKRIRNFSPSEFSTRPNKRRTQLPNNNSIQTSNVEQESLLAHQLQFIFNDNNQRPEQFLQPEDNSSPASETRTFSNENLFNQGRLFGSEHYQKTLQLAKSEWLVSLENNSGPVLRGRSPTAARARARRQKRELMTGIYFMTLQEIK